MIPLYAHVVRFAVCMATTVNNSHRVPVLDNSHTSCTNNNSKVALLITKSYRPLVFVILFPCKTTCIVHCSVPNGRVEQVDWPPATVFGTCLLPFGSHHMPSHDTSCRWSQSFRVLVQTHSRTTLQHYILFVTTILTAPFFPLVIILVYPDSSQSSFFIPSKTHRLPNYLLTTR